MLLWHFNTGRMENSEFAPEPEADEQEVTREISREEALLRQQCSKFDSLNQQKSEKQCKRLKFKDITDEEYLMEGIVYCLAPALERVEMERPPDPIAKLAGYLLQYQKKFERMMSEKIGDDQKSKGDAPAT